MVGSGIGDGVKSVGHGPVFDTVTVVRVTTTLGRPAAPTVAASATTAVGIQEDSILGDIGRAGCCTWLWMVCLIFSCCLEDGNDSGFIGKRPAMRSQLGPFPVTNTLLGTSVPGTRAAQSVARPITSDFALAVSSCCLYCRKGPDYIGCWPVSPRFHQLRLLLARARMTCSSSIKEGNPAGLAISPGPAIHSSKSCATSTTRVVLKVRCMCRRCLPPQCLLFTTDQLSSLTTQGVL